MELGLRHETIRQFLAGLMEIRLPKYPEQRVMESILERAFPAVASLGDGISIRLEVTDPDWDSGWLTLDNRAPLAEDFEPLVVVSLNLGQIYRKVLGKTP